MALSNAEKVRRYRERQRAKRQEELKQPTPPSAVFQTPFFEFFTESEQCGSQYSQSLELAGIEPLPFDDDSGPEVTTLDDLRDPHEDDGMSNPFGGAKGSSLGKAEVLIGCLLDAAADLASWVNAYKTEEIKARIAEIEAAELTDVDAKREAFGQVTELNRMLADLEKEFRWSLPIWKIDLPERETKS